MTKNKLIAIFGNVTRCSLLEVYWSIRGSHSFQLSVFPMMEGLAFSEILVTF